MWEDRKAKRLFERLCEDYYEKVLRYLYYALGDETAAREVVQEVFLTACAKRELLAQHPNPGGFLFLTAKNLAKKARREAFARMAREPLTADGLPPEQADDGAEIERALDAAVDTDAWVERVLARLDPAKRTLYNLHYVQGVPMKEIAARYGLGEAAVRMRYMRLRREIRELAARVAEENFMV